MAELATALSEAPQFDAAFRAAFAELLAWRRDVRHFRAGEAPDEATLAELFDLAALAPSVGNCQPTRFVRVDDEKRRALDPRQFRGGQPAGARRLQWASALSFMRSSSLPACATRRSTWRCFATKRRSRDTASAQRTMPETRRYSTVCALYTFWLAARARGLGVGWVSILDPGGIAEALDVPRAWTFIGYLCVGFPREEHLIPELERSGWQRREPHPVLRR